MYKIFLTIAFIWMLTYVSFYSPVAKTANVNWSNITGGTNAK